VTRFIIRNASPGGGGGRVPRFGPPRPSRQGPATQADPHTSGKAQPLLTQSDLCTPYRRQLTAQNSHTGTTLVRRPVRRSRSARGMGPALCFVAPLCICIRAMIMPTGEYTTIGVHTRTSRDLVRAIDAIPEPQTGLASKTRPAVTRRLVSSATTPVYRPAVARPLSDCQDRYGSKQPFSNRDAPSRLCGFQIPRRHRGLSLICVLFLGRSIPGHVHVL